MKIINQYLKEQRELDHNESVKAIVKRKNHILILRRTEGSPGAGMWDLPGGCIENEENKEDALIREVFEETNLKIDNIKYSEKFNLKIPEKGIDSQMNIYTCDALTIDVLLKPSSWEGADGKPEHNQYSWIEYKNDLINLPMLPQLKNVILKFLN